jgi:demethylmenaquinone methyltransferase/2-methoxy-6-polyprenyl-1,4-benzoquinol methylase
MSPAAPATSAPDLRGESAPRDWPCSPTSIARCSREGLAAQAQFLVANAECLPFADRSFDCVTIAFGLRNVTDKAAALASMRRVLRPAGRLLVLEFSKPTLEMLRPAYDAYSFNVLPWLGGIIAGDAASYRYLAESIRMHPDQQTLAAMFREAGFDECRWHNLAGGIVALHVGVVH